MEFVNQLAAQISALIWGPFMLALIMGVGIFLMCGLKFKPLTKIPVSFKLLFTTDNISKKNHISPFQALMTSLSATIGTGNIVGVATAIAMGGPGALFWMWCAAIIGIATKYAEAVCAVHYREYDAHNKPVGGPMYYIKNGLSKKWAWLGTAFAIFGALAGFGIGNTIQSNAIANTVSNVFGIPAWGIATVLTILVGLVLIGGLNRIAQVAGKLVPMMAIGYLLIGLSVILFNASALPEAFALIFHHAFTPAAASGGFAGAAVWAAIRFGVARGIFSNEAGLGSAAIAHASAKTTHPVKQGMVAMLGVVIDTLIICSITGLAIITSGVWNSDAEAITLTSNAFATVWPQGGDVLVAISLSVFSFTTILGWSVYSERCIQYLLGHRAIIPFRFLWVAAVPAGALFNMEFVWLMGDILNGFMAIPNLVALLLLGPVVFRLTKEYFNNPSHASYPETATSFKRGATRIH